MIDAPKIPGITFLKKMKPDALIIVIGPSDMGISNTESQTYKFLENVINCLKETTISEDCLYWNTYEVMGGCGAIKKWSANPNIQILGNPEAWRLSIVSFMVLHGSQKLHYNFFPRPHFSTVETLVFYNENEISKINKCT